MTGANFAVYQTAVSDPVPQQPSIGGAVDIGNTAYISSLIGEPLAFGAAWCVHARACVRVCLLADVMYRGPGYTFHLQSEDIFVILSDFLKMFERRLRVQYLAAFFGFVCYVYESPPEDGSPNLCC